MATVSETAEKAKSAVVPNFVTESTYTEDIPGRGMVGDTQNRPRLGAQALLLAATQGRPETAPVSLSIDRDPAAAAAVGLGREGTVYVDPYSGTVLGSGSAGARSEQTSGRAPSATPSGWRSGPSGSSPSPATTP